MVKKMKLHILRLALSAAAAMCCTASFAAGPASIDTALNCIRPLQCPYFGDLFNDDAAFKKAVNDSFAEGKRRPPAWLAKGASTPMRPLLLRGKWYLIGSVSEPNKAAHMVMALYAAETQSASVLYVDPKGSNVALGNGDAEAWRVLELVSRKDTPLAQMVNADDAPLPIALDGMMR